MKIIKVSNVFNEQLFHGSSIENINKLVPNKSVLRGYGIFLSNSLKYAKVFGEYIYICEVNLSNPKTYDDSLDFEVDCMRNDGVDKLYDALQLNGYDGVIIYKSKVSIGIVKEVICFNENSVKIIRKL
jgi:hypothetical protein